MVVRFLAEDDVLPLRASVMTGVQVSAPQSRPAMQMRNQHEESACALVTVLAPVSLTRE